MPDGKNELSCLPTKVDIYESFNQRTKRYTICTMLQSGYPQCEIARVINKDKSVVSREIRRNADARSGQYKDDLAHRKYLKRQAYKVKREPSHLRLKHMYEINCVSNTVRNKLQELPKQMEITVSHERIYQFIWQDKRKKGRYILT